MEREQEITSRLQKLQEVITDVNKFLQIERVSVELVRGDISSMEAVRDKLMRENDVIRRQIEVSKGMANSIIQVANEKALDVTNAKEMVLIEAQTILQLVKDFVKENDVKRFSDHLRNIDRLKEKDIVKTHVKSDSRRG